MSRWYEYQVNQPNSNGDVSALVRRIAEVERRQTAFEQRLAFLERRPVASADQARTPYGWGSDEVGDAYYHRDEYNDLAGVAGRIVPWISTNVRFAESLTDPKFVWATFGQASLLGLAFTIMGGGATVMLSLPWYAPVVIGLGGFGLSVGVLIAHNRSLLDTTVKAQHERDQRHRLETHLQIDELEGNGRIRSIKFLLVSGVTPEQLREWAVKVQDGSDLAIKAWTGRGALFSESQYTALMKELERAGYVEPGRGNVARSLTRPGKALLKQLVKI